MSVKDLLYQDSSIQKCHNLVSTLTLPSAWFSAKIFINQVNLCSNYVNNCFLEVK